MKKKKAKILRINKVISKGERIRVVRLLRYIKDASSLESQLLYGKTASFYLFTMPLVKKIGRLFNLSEDELKSIINTKVKTKKKKKK